MRFVTIIALGVGMTCLAFGQAVVVNGNPGYNYDSPYNKLYSPSTVVTFKGKVSGIQVTTPMPGMGHAISLFVKDTNGKTRRVDVGPEWYVNNQRTKIRVKDNVQVTGSRVSIDGSDVILAEQIVKNKDVLALRRPAGRPYWDATVTVTANQTPADIGKNKLINGQIVALDIYSDGTNGPVPSVPWFIQRTATFGSSWRRLGTWSGNRYNSRSETM